MRLNKSTPPCSKKNVWDIYTFQRGTKTVGVTQLEYHGLGLKVALMGAMTRVGQPLSLLLKQSPWFDEIAVHDCVDTRGLALELNHVDTKSSVTACTGMAGHQTALKGADIVLITAGIPSEKQDESPSEQTLQKVNGKAVMEISANIATICPKAFVCVASCPVNFTLPIACKVIQSKNKFVDHNKMFGLTTLSAIRADSLVAEVLQVNPDTVSVPVIGGQSPTTTVPVLSKTKPSSQLTTEEVVRITRAVQTAGDEVARAYDGKDVACLSQAYAIARFASSLARAINGDQKNNVECAFVMSNMIPDLEYFATPLQLGPEGIQKNMGIPDLSSYECCLLETAIPFIKKDVKAAEEFVTDAIKIRAF